MYAGHAPTPPEAAAREREAAEEEVRLSDSWEESSLGACSAEDGADGGASTSVPSSSGVSLGPLQPGSSERLLRLDESSLPLDAEWAEDDPAPLREPPPTALLLRSSSTQQARDASRAKERASRGKGKASGAGPLGLEELLESLSSAGEPAQAARIWARIGQLHQRRKRFSEAHAAYSAAVRLDGSQHGSLANLAQIEAHGGNLSAARQLLARASSLDPRNKVYLAFTQWLSCEAGLHKQARCSRHSAARCRG